MSLLQNKRLYINSMVFCERYKEEYKEFSSKLLEYINKEFDKRIHTSINYTESYGSQTKFKPDNSNLTNIIKDFDSNEFIKDSKNMGKIECIASDYLKDLAQKMINSGSSIQEVDNRLEKELENYRNLIDEKRNFSAPTNLTEIFNKIEDRVKYKRAERNHPRMEKYYNPFTNTDDFEL